MTKWPFFDYCAKSLAALVFIIAASIPHLAEAGFFSSISELLIGEANAGAESSLNSQNMALLQAVLSSDPNPSKGGGDITVVGGTALLPESGPTGTLADLDKDSNPLSTQISVYVVRQGDTLSGIARMYGVSVNTIIWGNDLRNSIIREGQTLIILPVTGVRHVVKSGDTLKSIAKKYKGDLGEILDYNNLPEDAALTVGEVIIVPDGEVAYSNYVSNTPRGTGGPSLEGYYMRPIIGGRRTQGLHGYNGVDLGVSYGSPIYAAAPGTVIISRNGGWNGGYGKYIVVSHPNGTQTLYAHNSDNVVFAGANVIRGQVIGFVGSTGKSTGPHLHFEVRGARNPF